MTLQRDDIPNPTDEPLLAAYLKLQKLRSDMSGELYDEHEQVREWAMDVEWAYTAIAEHEDVDIDDLRSELAEGDDA